jgi:cytosine/adenosine deaminase-related metal-dependent hydrolase
MDLLVTGGTVLSMEDGAAPRKADVLVRDGRIVSVGRSTGSGPARILDATGAAVLPGFVQCHVHLCQTLARGRADDLALLPWLRERIWPYEAALDEETLRASARLGLAELVRGGTTAILDMGTVRHHDVVMESIEEAGIRAASGKAMMDAPSVPEGLRERTGDSIAESERLRAKWDGAAGGRIHYAFAPRFSLSCTEKLLRTVAEISVATGALIHTHAAENADERAAVRAERGEDDVAYLASLGISGPRVFLAHGVQLTDEEIASVAESGTRLVHCPSSNLKLGSGIARVAAWERAGIEPVLGADGAPCNNRLDAFREMHLGAVLQAARAGPGSWPAARVLRAATRGGAEALGLDSGVLAPGRAADLVVVDVETLHSVPADDVASRVVYSAGPEDVRHVVCAGEVLVQDGRLLSIDAREVVADARRLSSRRRTRSTRRTTGRSTRRRGRSG